MASQPFIPDAAILFRKVMSRTRAWQLGYSRKPHPAVPDALSFVDNPWRESKMVYCTARLRMAIPVLIRIVQPLRTLLRRRTKVPAALRGGKGWKGRYM